MIAIVSVSIDVATSNILFILFSIGSLFAVAADFAGFSLPVQIIIFLLVSIVSFLVFYPYLRKNLRRTLPGFIPQERTYIGRKIMLDRDLKDEDQMMIEGIYWTVKNVGDEPLKKGDVIEISGIEGTKFLLKKAKEE
ncbi:MAG: NfeD family protein [Tepidanaerobacteraceae bacterium]|nr:NfeD family protein [Tepidanaerobacteraceae bacterium]